jgi:HD-like signal output (HDOD) protein
MDTWNFPNELKLVASQYTNFTDAKDGPATYVDVVQVAFLQSIVGTDHPACRVDCSTVDAFNKLGLSTESEILEIEGISDKIELAKESLF